MTPFALGFLSALVLFASHAGVDSPGRPDLTAAPFEQIDALLPAGWPKHKLQPNPLAPVKVFLGGTFDAGRDDHPQAFSVVLEGGGVKAGYVYEKTDKEGRGVEEAGRKMPDLNATIVCALGLPCTETVFSPSQRPFRVAEKGKPAIEVFA